MAGNSLYLRFKMLGDASGLTSATKKASKDLKGLGGVGKQLGGALKGLLAGLSFAAITNGLIQSTKAAAEDARSMALLAKTIQNVVPKQAKLTSSVEESISSMSVMAAVADDEIRPSMAYLVKATKSVTKASHLMGLALDVSADSGVSLDQASKLLGKAFNGNTTALFKLYPALKKVKNPMAALEKQVKGMAELKGDNDPFGRMSIMVKEAQESIGKVLLPEVKKLAKYLSSPEGKKMIEATVSVIKDLVREGIKLGKWAVENKDTLLTIAGIIATLKVGNSTIQSYKNLRGVWQGLVKAKGLLAGQGVADAAAGTTGAGGGVGAGGAGAAGKAALGSRLAALATPALVTAGAAAAVVAMKAQSYQGASGKKNVLGDIRRARAEYGQYYSATELLTATGKKNIPTIGSGGSNMAAIGGTTNITVNVSQPVTDGEIIVNAIKRYAARNGRKGTWNLGSL